MTTKGDEELALAIHKILERHNSNDLLEDEDGAPLPEPIQEAHRAIIRQNADDAVNEIVQFMRVVIDEYVEFHRADADGDWRAAIRTLSAGQPTYAMPHPMTLLDRAEYLVQNLRDNRPEADDDR